MPGTRSSTSGAGEDVDLTNVDLTDSPQAPESGELSSTILRYQKHRLKPKNSRPLHRRHVSHRPLPPDALPAHTDGIREKPLHNSEMTHCFCVETENQSRTKETGKRLWTERSSRRSKMVEKLERNSRLHVEFSAEEQSLRGKIQGLVMAIRSASRLPWRRAVG